MNLTPTEKIISELARGVDPLEWRVVADYFEEVTDQGVADHWRRAADALEALQHFTGLEQGDSGFVQIGDITMYFKVHRSEVFLDGGRWHIQRESLRRAKPYYMKSKAFAIASVSQKLQRQKLQQEGKV